MSSIKITYIGGLDSGCDLRESHGCGVTVNCIMSTLAIVCGLYLHFYQMFSLGAVELFILCRKWIHAIWSIE